MMSSRWFLVLPPMGAARIAALHTVEAFKSTIPHNNIKVFDTLQLITVFRQQLKNQNDDLIVDLVNQSLIVSCLDFSANYVLVFALSPVTLFALHLLKKQGLKTIHWFYEDYMRATYWEQVLEGYNHFLTIQRGPFPDICKNKGINWHFLPAAASITAPESIDTQARAIDIAFIGIPSSYRIKVLDFIAEKKWNIAIAGAGWSEYKGPLQKFIICADWVNEEQSSIIFQKAKIGINLSVNDPQGRQDVHVSPRIFDILLSGAVCITEETSLLCDTIGTCPIDTFNNFDTLESQIRRNIELFDSTLDDRIAKSNFVKENHLYKNRVSDIISFVI